MPSADDVAVLLVAYDSRLAARVVAALANELGAPTDDPARLRAYLAGPESVPDGAQTTTAEWKAQFTLHEAMRGLALALLDRMEPS